MISNGNRMEARIYNLEKALELKLYDSLKDKKYMEYKLEKYKKQQKEGGPKESIFKNMKFHNPVIGEAKGSAWTPKKTRRYEDEDL